MAVDVYASIKELIQNILGNRDAALQFASDPDGTLAAQGITDGDLSQVDIREMVDECATGTDVPESTRQALQSYSSGSASSSYPVSTPPAHSATQSAADVVQHLNYVTYASYEGDEQITQQLINYEDYSTDIDNSVDFNVDGNVEGGIDFDSTNVNATGDGAVAAGRDIDNAATGDGSQIIDGDNLGNANTGDGALQAGGSIDGPVNTGEFTGVQADGDVENAVVGDNNQTSNIDSEGGDITGVNVGFGEGDQSSTNVVDSDVDDAAITGGGGNAENVSDIEDGSAVSTGTGDATGSFEKTEIDADQSTVATEQGAGDQQVDQQLDQQLGGQLDQEPDLQLPQPDVQLDQLEEEPEDVASL